MSYAKTSQPGLLRDMNTHAIINTNDSEYQSILDRRRNIKQTQQIQSIQNQIDGLKNEFLEIKQMLRQVLSGRT